MADPLIVADGGPIDPDAGDPLVTFALDLADIREPLVLEHRDDGQRLKYTHLERVRTLLHRQYQKASGPAVLRPHHDIVFYVCDTPLPGLPNRFSAFPIIYYEVANHEHEQSEKRLRGSVQDRVLANPALAPPGQPRDPERIIVEKALVASLRKTQTAAFDRVIVEFDRSDNTVADDGTRGRTLVLQYSSVACFVCIICETDYYVLDPLVTSRCDHEGETCAPCIDRWVQNAVDQGRAPNNIACMVCEKRMDYHDVRRLVSDDTFERYDRMSTRNVVSEMPDFHWCLSASCLSGQFHYIDGAAADDEKAREFCCCVCGHTHCTFHERPHPGLSCAEYDAKISSNRVLENSSERTIQKVARRCPGCGRRLQKMGGCDHIICSCGHEFCYKCGASYAEGIVNHGESCRDWALETADQHDNDGTGHFWRDWYDLADMIDLVFTTFQGDQGMVGAVGFWGRVITAHPEMVMNENLPPPHITNYAQYETWLEERRRGGYTSGDNDAVSVEDFLRVSNERLEAVYPEPSSRLLPRDGFEQAVGNSNGPTTRRFNGHVRGHPGPPQEGVPVPIVTPIATLPPLSEFLLGGPGRRNATVPPIGDLFPGGRGRRNAFSGPSNPHLLPADQPMPRRSLRLAGQGQPAGSDEGKLEVAYEDRALLQAAESLDRDHDAPRMRHSRTAIRLDSLRDEWDPWRSSIGDHRLPSIGDEQLFRQARLPPLRPGRSMGTTQQSTDQRATFTADFGLSNGQTHTSDSNTPAAPRTPPERSTPERQAEGSMFRSNAFWRGAMDFHSRQARQQPEPKPEP